MKILTLSLTLFFVSILHGQNFHKSNEPFTAYNDHVYKVGDRIQLATPADFSNDFLYIFRDNDITDRLKAVVEIGDEKINYKFTVGYIEYFKVDPDFGTYAVIADGGIMININKAIKTLEIITQKYYKANVNNSTYLEDSVAYIRMLNKLGNVTDKQVKEYLYLFENKEYNRIREDEFEFYERVNQTKEMLLRKAVNTVFSDTLKFELIIDLDSYNFEKQGFSFNWGYNKNPLIMSDKYESMSSETLDKEKVDLTAIKLLFENSDDFDFLPLNKENANYFIKHRKDKEGNVNRAVSLFIHFVINGIEEFEIDPEYFSNYSTLRRFGAPFYNGQQFSCKILKVSVFEGKGGYCWLNDVEN